MKLFYRVSYHLTFPVPEYIVGPIFCAASLYRYKLSFRIAVLDQSTVSTKSCFDRPCSKIRGSPCGVGM